MNGFLSECSRLRSPRRGEVAVGRLCAAFRRFFASMAQANWILSYQSSI